MFKVLLMVVLVALSNQADHSQEIGQRSKAYHLALEKTDFDSIWELSSKRSKEGFVAFGSKEKAAQEFRHYFGIYKIKLVDTPVVSVVEPMRLAKSVAQVQVDIPPEVKLLTSTLYWVLENGNWHVYQHDLQ
jgi:hypothetical protein